MKKTIDFVKKIYSVSKEWIIKNGVEGVAGLLAGFGLWIFGYKIWAGFSFGVFATKNWDILKDFLKRNFEKSKS